MNNNKEEEEVVSIRTAGAGENAQPFVFLFGRIVHRTIRIRPNSLKPLFGTPLESLTIHC